jgi:hypothetical protein
VIRQTVLTHAEVQRTPGIKQKGKWNIMGLPGVAAAGDAIERGDRLMRLPPAWLRPALQPQTPREHQGRPVGGSEGAYQERLTCERCL